MMRGCPLNGVETPGVLRRIREDYQDHEQLQTPVKPIRSFRSAAGFHWEVILHVH